MTKRPAMRVEGSGPGATPASARALTQVMVLVLAMCIAAPALAYMDYVPMMANGAWQANSANYMKKWRRYVDARQLGAQAPAEATTQAAAQSQAAAATTVLQPAAHPSSAPADLAAAYPAAQRRDIEQAFRELLSGYRKIERQFGIPRDDMAGAVAALIAGSWMAYRNRDFPDANFPPLVRQMRAILASTPAFRNASAQEKRETFDRMVILGTLMATVQMAQKQRPDPRSEANTREAARGYLEQFLQTDAERIDLNAQGLQLR